MDNQGVGKEQELFERSRIVVDPGQEPLRIDKFLMDRLANVTRNRVQMACHGEMIFVNDKTVKPNYKVKPNDVIRIIMPKPPFEPLEVIPEDIPLNIVYEDDDLLILNKQVGLVVHPGVGNYHGTLVNALAHYLGNSDLPVMEGDPPNRIGLVHRIDKNTSGLMVIAKNDHTLTHLAKQFFDHTINREYLALVWGNFNEPKGTIEGHIGRHPKNRVVRHVFPDGEQGKHAITHYEVVEDLYYVSLVKCRLETGRTHQIRVHMQHKHHPVFNDEKYGGDRIIKGTVYSKYKQFVNNCFEMIPRHALHARSLGFMHPTKNEMVEFTSELPEDMATVLDKWRNYVEHKK